MIVSQLRVTGSRIPYPLLPWDTGAEVDFHSSEATEKVQGEWEVSECFRIITGRMECGYPVGHLFWFVPFRLLSSLPRAC